MPGFVLVVLSILSLHPAAPPARDAARGDSTTRKTWSNDDIKFLEQNAPLSIFRPAATPGAAGNAAASEASAVRRRYVKELDPQWYAGEIEARRERLDSVDASLQQLENARKSGQGVTDVFPLYASSPGILVLGTFQVLRAQDGQLRSEIAEFQDLGRVKEIPRNATR